LSCHFNFGLSDEELDALVILWGKQPDILSNVSAIETQRCKIADTFEQLPFFIPQKKAAPQLLLGRHFSFS
jgi:hypothetical protein